MGIDELVARDSIANILARHSRGVDRAHLELLAGAYHGDATVEYGFFDGPGSKLAEILATAQASSPPTLHRTSNMWIRVQGERAVSESYVVAYVEEAETQRIVMGRYLDRHSLRDGRWALDFRRYVMDANVNWQSNVARPAPSVSPAAFAPQGAKMAQDSGLALLNLHKLTQPHKPRCANQESHIMTDSALDALISRAAIMDLVCAYARAADRGDAELMASIFHEDAVVMCGIANGNGEAFAQAITQFVTANLERCFHSTSNSWIEIDGDGAVGEHYVIAHMTTGDNDIMTGGRYIDRYERREGVWKISNRSFVMDWNTIQPSTYQDDGFYAALTGRGCFGKADPVYQHWAGN